MKIGRVKLKVREYRTDTESFNIETDGEFEEFKETRVITDTPDESDDILCKYCYTSESIVENPLVEMCKCAGSIKYVHYNCLKMWLKSQKQEKSEGSTHSIHWKRFECEMCKTAYPCKLLCHLICHRQLRLLVQRRVAASELSFGRLPETKR